MNILNVFKSVLSLAFAGIKKVVTNDQLKLAIKLVKIAAANGLFTNDEARREFVVAALVKEGIPESLARWLVETALQVVKRKLA